MSSEHTQTIMELTLAPSDIFTVIKAGFYWKWSKVTLFRTIVTNKTICKSWLFISSSAIDFKIVLNYVLHDSK